MPDSNQPKSRYVRGCGWSNDFITVVKSTPCGVRYEDTDQGFRTFMSVRQKRGIAFHE